MRDPSCYPRRGTAAHAHTRETLLATQYPRRHQLSHTQIGDPSCHCRRLLDLHYPAHLRCSTALAFTVHRYLIYPFLQNLIQCLWISKSKNLCLWCLCFYWWMMNWCRWSVIVNLKIYSACGVFLFLAFWLCDSLWLCVCDSLSCII